MRLFVCNMNKRKQKLTAQAISTVAALIKSACSFPDNRNNNTFCRRFDKGLLQWLLHVPGHAIFLNTEPPHRDRGHHLHRSFLRMLRGGQGKLLHGRHGKARPKPKRFENLVPFFFAVFDVVNCGFHLGIGGRNRRLYAQEQDCRFLKHEVA